MYQICKQCCRTYYSAARLEHFKEKFCDCGGELYESTGEPKKLGEHSRKISGLAALLALIPFKFI